MSVVIHPTAIVDPRASLGEGTTVGAYSIIGPDVVLGKNNIVGPHVVIEGITKAGDGNHFFQFCSVGSRPQDLKYRGEASELHLGDGNMIREYVTLQPGTTGGGMFTRIGSRNLFMANCHVGHDCTIGDRCVFANSAGLAGHVTVGNGVVVGGLSGIHQFVRLGDIVMLGAGSMVTEDIPPFCMAQGDRAKIMGLNRVGLERNGASNEDMRSVRRVYSALFSAGESSGVGSTFQERVGAAQAVVSESVWARQFVEFLQGSSRGIAAHRRKGGADTDSDEG